jgi:uncharacterized protein
MENLYIDGMRFYNMVINASNKLEEQKGFVNYLNVFPVPDGDTGTNMSMTFRAAVSEIQNPENKTIGEVSKILAKGALMGARGNSGVILSQILRGIAKGLENKETATALDLANSLMEGSKSAYKAVMRPTEGTILTIIKAAGESAIKSTNEDVIKLMAEVCEYSEYMLNKTPDMLPALKKANVVDAGGMGLLILLKGMYDALESNIQPVIMNINQENWNNASPAANINEEDIKFAYCTELFILGKNINIEEFKNDIEPLGDSMIVVGLEDVVKLHIHTNDPGLILSKAVKLGELSKIKIENMKEQHRHIIDEFESMDKEATEKVEDFKKYGFIAVAMGEGIKNIFEDLGVDFVIEGGQTMNPSTQDILECINKLNSDNIFVFPNNKNIIMAATQAAELSDKNIIVIPTTTIPQGVTAITVFNNEAELEENVSEMKAAISKVTNGSITYAVRDTEADGNIIKENDILGLVEGKIREVGKDIYEVCERVINNIVKEDSELITIFYGSDCDESKVNELLAVLEEQYSDIDIQCYNGKQPLYYFIVSVE